MDAEALIRRLQRLEPMSQRRWGQLSPDEMLCHLGDAFRGAMGERPFVPASNWFARNVIKRIALHTSMRWPQGVKTPPEFDPRDGGTRPEAFESDREALTAVMRRFAAPDAQYASHPIFGAMTREEWLIWGERHVDHHLRQFGL
jgi:Protein of unknown function (DUF1569)